MANTPTTPPSFSSGRKWGAGLHAFLSVLALLAVVVMGNFIASRHFRRVPLTAENDWQLSSLTLQALRSVTNQVRVVVFYDRDEVLYSSVTALLKEYTLANPRIRVEAVDPNHEPSKAELIKAQFKLAPNARDLVIVAAGAKVKFIPQAELSEYDYSRLMSGQSQEIKRKSFNGERLFTGAILSVCDPQTTRVYFLFGHGEHDPRVADQASGYAKFAASLQENSLDTKLLVLTGTNEVPADCQLLVVPGPLTAFDAAEQEKLDKYLGQGGRLLLLLRQKSHTGLESLLARWGVEVGENLVVDEINSKSGDYVVVGHFEAHPIVNPLGQANLLLQLVQPRSVDKRAGRVAAADAAQVVELVKTTKGGVALSDPRKGQLPADRTGEIPLMAAMEKGSIKGVRGSARMVVAGDSLFLDNQMLDAAANRDFAWHAVNWLLDRPQLLGGIGPRPVREYSFTMTAGQMRTMNWILLAGIPGAIVILGMLVWLRRRR